MAKLLLRARWQSFKERMNQANAISNYQTKNRNNIIILGSLIFVCGILYLWQINCMATSGYEIKELENKAAALKDENKDLQVQITELRSTSRLETKIAELKMVEVARVEYLQANGSTVAMNR
jgi:cell division protein FtsL